jgi:hypothetical protein
VGFGGLGKTTLACEVRRELRGQFDCQVTVQVSQSPDIIKILTMILSEVKGPSQHRICNVSELIEELKSYLLHKRYLISTYFILSLNIKYVPKHVLKKNLNGFYIVLCSCS